MALSLEKQLLFYGAYHNNPVNIVIHIICVPVLLFTGILIASNTSAIFSLPEILRIEYLPPNLGTIAGFIYAIFYMLLEPVAGVMLAPAIIGGATYANYLLSTYGSVVNYWAGGAHIISWLVQFVGHGVFERRAPAFLDNLIQALLLAPLFVWMEVLFYLGYRPELRARYEQSVDKEIATFKRPKANGAK